MKQAKETMDVERLVTWALVEQGLGWAMFGQAQGSGGGMAALGTRIDGGTIRAPSVSLLSDDDALVVRDAILAAGPEVAQMIIRFGRTGTRPDWCEDGAGYWRQKRAANGKLAWHYAKSGDRRSERTAVMEFIGEKPEDVERWRADYMAWWDALAALVDVVNAGMVRHEARPPRVSRSPWDQPVSRILTSEGPIERHRKPEDKVSAEYVEIRGKRVRRDLVRDGA